MEMKKLLSSSKESMVPNDAFATNKKYNIKKETIGLDQVF